MSFLNLSCPEIWDCVLRLFADARDVYWFTLLYLWIHARHTESGPHARLDRMEVLYLPVYYGVASASCAVFWGVHRGTQAGAAARGLNDLCVGLPARLVDTLPGSGSGDTRLDFLGPVFQYFLLVLGDFDVLDLARRKPIPMLQTVSPVTAAP